MIALGSSTASLDIVGQVDGAARHAKLMKASQEFEAIMLEVLLKPLGKGSAIAGEEDDAGAEGPLQSFGIQAMASSLAKSGALGFAAKITGAVEKHDPKNVSKKDDPVPQVALTLVDK